MNVSQLTTPSGKESDSLPFRRSIRSFVKREGRLSQGQRLALENSPYLLQLEHVSALLNWSDLFGFESNRRVVELGFGDGDSLLQMAKQAPETQFIGIEVYRCGVGQLLRQLTVEGIQNVRVVMGDASALLDRLFEPASLDAIQIFFPDPWHKKRHNKRRLFQLPFATRLVDKLREGGLLHLATDWEDYAEEILAVIQQLPQLHNLAGAEHFIPRPTVRPLTKYERRGLRLGHQIRDIQCHKIATKAGML